MKGYSAFPYALALLEPHHLIIQWHIQDRRWGILPLYRDAVSVFYGYSRLDNCNISSSFYALFWYALHVAYRPAGQTTKNSQIYKNIIYNFILRRRRLSVVRIRSGRVRTYLTCVVGTFLWSGANGRRTHTGSWEVCLSD